MLVVPLKGETGLIGTLTLFVLGSPRRFDRAGVAFAELIGNEVADVLEWRRLQEAVAAEWERAGRVLEHAGDGVFLLDGGGVVRLWNAAAAAIMGVRAEDAVGRTAEEIVPGWETIARLVEIARAPGQAALRTQTVPIEFDGRERWVAVSAVRFADGSVYTVRDLTEERAVDELKSDFVSTVSHELRTPLAAVYGAAMTLGRHDLDLDGATRERLLGVIAGESDRLARIVNDLLWTSRLDSGRFHVAVESCDPAELAQGVIDAATAHAKEGISLELDVKEPLPPVAADPDRVRQVLVNLVDNAVKYSPDGGTVRVLIEPWSAWVRFSVADKGLGIPLHEQRRIFEKFYRLDPNLTRGVGGTGLGLYICRELVRRMGGRIWVASREGQGSTFFFDLPVAAEAATAAARAESVS